MKSETNDKLNQCLFQNSVNTSTTIFSIYYIKMKVCMCVCRTRTSYHPEIWRGLISPGLGTKPGGDPKC